VNELALFAGAGGGILGTHLLGFRPVCAVEIEPYAREILLRRQEDKILPTFPIWDNVRTFDGKPWRGIVDVVTAGFPCQPFSVAGSQKGSDDERNGWPDTIRIIREVGPEFALLENVPGLVRFDYFGQILGDLAEAGFDAEWGIVSAEETGAPHKRERLWIVANSKHSGIPQRRGTETTRCGGKRRNRISSNEPSSGGEQTIQGTKKSIPDTSIYGSEARISIKRPSEKRNTEESINGCDGASRKNQRIVDWWSTEPKLGRVAHGVAYRVDRIKAIGNGQVPAVVERAWEILNKE